MRPAATTLKGRHLLEALGRRQGRHPGPTHCPSHLECGDLVSCQSDPDPGYGASRMLGSGRPGSSPEMIRRAGVPSPLQYGPHRGRPCSPWGLEFALEGQWYEEERGDSPHTRAHGFSLSVQLAPCKCFVSLSPRVAASLSSIRAFHFPGSTHVSVEGQVWLGHPCLPRPAEPPIDPAPPAETLPPPWLSAQPVPWITPGLDTKLLCRGGFRGVTFLLRLEGDDQFLEVAEAPADVEAAFPVRQPGNYSCSYRTHAAGSPSEPSATVTVTEPGAPLPPTLSLMGGESAEILHPGTLTTLVCTAPLTSVHFQLRRGEEVLQVPMSSTTPGRISFHLKAVALDDRGLYTCRYQLHDQPTWSWDSEPVELLVSDGKPGGLGLEGDSASLRGRRVGGETRGRVPRYWTAPAGARSRLIRPASVSPPENETMSSATPRPQEE
ncbi:alpha-1B-glycoprotein-like [Suricata suricatta]|uniref:alpha-1B-glycoprotein-like n=1 Tax=Suricata suricatta TaxID=37032 RepID=UPI0011554DFF|nr:alpha-1B-glycoprotein-like [Suricata suricatta]